MNEYTTVTLDKELRPRAINAVEIELKEKVADETPSSEYSVKHTINVGVKDQNTSKYIPDDSSNPNIGSLFTNNQ